MKGFIKIISVMAIFITTCASCNAEPPTDIRDLIKAQKANGYGKVINDSIADIIMNPKLVNCQLVSKNPTDSLRQDTLRTLSKGMETVLIYLFFNEENFKGNQTVYGNFIPWVRFTFNAKKKRTVYLELDFGLAKWRLLDKDKKVFCMQDMKVQN